MADDRPSENGGRIEDPSDDVRVEAERSRRAVGETYDAIADHFARTRATPWPEVETFLKGRAGRLGADIGCGNGRHAEPLADRVDRVIGVDASVELLRLSRERAVEAGYAGVFDALAGDAARLPIRTDAADLALYVAALHHLPARSLRLTSLSELDRILAPGGRALVSVWSTTHDRFDADPDAEEGFDATIDWTLPDGETVPRFYHVYAPAEFDADLRASSLSVERSFRSSGNCYAVVRGVGASATPNANERSE